MLVVVSCSGFWPVIFSLIVTECMTSPELPRSLLCIPVQIPSKFYPLVLYLFFCLFTGPQLDLACAIGVGYLHSNGFLDKLKVSIFESNDSSGVFRIFAVNCSSWISAGHVALQDGSLRNSNPTNQRVNVAGTYAFPTPSETLKSDNFPGVGHTMTTSTSSTGLSWKPLLSNDDVSAPSREVLAARRMANLANNNDCTFKEENALNDV